VYNIDRAIYDRIGQYKRKDFTDINTNIVIIKKINVAIKIILDLLKKPVTMGLLLLFIESSSLSCVIFKILNAIIANDIKKDPIKSSVFGNELFVK
jgi:hypothetical protein